MPVFVHALDELMPKAVKHFWKARKLAVSKQKNRGISDQGNRAGVTAGKNLDGFVAMIRQIIQDNGIKDIQVCYRKRLDLTIPGFYRPTKNWDLLVLFHDLLIAAVEFKSQVGPSFGNNFNNRIEEALGNGLDLNTAFREGAFGQSPKPFVGYFFVLEECTESTRKVTCNSKYFDVFPDFKASSYAQRYEIFCRKLVQEQLYDAATLILTPKDSLRTGEYRNMSEITSARRFATTLAGKIASIAAGG